MIVVPEWQGNSDPAVASRVAEQLPLLATLRRHLEEMASYVEQHVAEVCRDFGEIAHLATMNVDAGEAAVEGSGNEQREIEKLIATAETMLERIGDRNQRSTRLAADVLSRLENTREEIGHLKGVMAEVDQIALGTRLLGVNSRIEAAHIGEHGRAFATVADQMAQLSGQTQRVAERIERIVLDVSREVDSITEEMASVSVEMTDSDGIEMVLAGLRKAHRDMESSLRLSSQRGRQLVGRITSAVIGLQFQDRLTQRIQHICSALEGMERALSTSGAACNGGHLMGSPSMPEERAAQNIRGNRVTEPVLAGSGEAELF
jgi:methyl-accepting chemotaxis protein